MWSEVTADRPQVPEPLRLAGHVVYLGVEMDPGAMVTDLMVHVRVPLGRFEAAKARLAFPRLADGPAQGGGPEPGARVGVLRRNVDDHLHPVHGQQCIGLSRQRIVAG